MIERGDATLIAPGATRVGPVKTNRNPSAAAQKLCRRGRIALEGEASVACSAEAVAGHHLGLIRRQALFDPPRARSPGQARR